MGSSVNDNRFVGVVLRVSGGFALMSVVLFLSVHLATSETVVSIVSRFGYGGVFLVAILSGFNIVVPVPAVTFLPLFTASDLLFLPVLLLITVGMTIGDMFGFFIGDAGRRLRETVRKGEKKISRLHEYVQRAQDKHPSLPYIILMLYTAFAPAPNEVLVIPMAFAGYPLRRMFPVILAGNFIFNTFAALGVFHIASFL